MSNPTIAQRTINAIVVSSGLMQKTIKVRIGHQEWNSHIKKYYAKPTTLLVHDPASSTRTGDVIAIQPGWRASKHVRHVVSAIIAPFGTPVEERPRVLSEEEREAIREEKGRKKTERRRVAKGGKGLRRGGEEGGSAKVDDGVEDVVVGDGEGR